MLFMLVIVYIFYIENLYDKVFFDVYIFGFEKFVFYLLGEIEDKIVKILEWVVLICGVFVEKICEFVCMLVGKCI